ncbi:hypothetical protein UA08_02320 [Talaromyces atroroseus]|uniref:FAD dependent oxidoreductase domain-containing protein n=1 Tax=Talaromyces atroroseus TaxID=1441469 RepID=A0A225ATV2_TALAT|nr:hypothetical protein UA08_02320 [Talaromyces atroroseus]OKL61794.1 hypothetical protein UA08_02320 [Talaromyces atroroseus]
MDLTKVPSDVIIIGAGIFGLSTALAISKRHPHYQITVIDRLTPPVIDGTSVDTTRCIRADYPDPIYARLASEAQKKIEADPDLAPYYFKQGMTFACDGKPGKMFDFWQRGLDNVRKQHAADSIIEMNSAEEVFRRIHGVASNPVPDDQLERERKWIRGYTNLEDAFIDAEASVRVYYERCLARKNIVFVCGTPVRNIIKDPQSQTATGVMLEDRRQLKASLVLLAAGAWSNTLVNIEELAYSSAIEVAWIPLTPDECERWKNMSITTNLSTGFNLFPPYNSEMKCLRRSPGYCNTVTIPDPENPEGGHNIKVSVPRTVVTNPTDVIPQDAENALRDNLRELMPSIAGRKFDRTKLCWISQTPTADFIISPHPHTKNLHIATGGSAHAWKFLPIIGDLVLDSIEGKLDAELVRKWAWGRHGSDGGNAPRMSGNAQELRDVVRSQTGDVILGKI